VDPGFWFRRGTGRESGDGSLPAGPGVEPRWESGLWGHEAEKPLTERK